MRQIAEFAVFLTMAGAAHLVAFSPVPNVSGTVVPSSDAQAMTLAPASDTLSDLVAVWDRPVDAIQSVALPPPVETTTTKAVTPQRHASTVPRTALSAPVLQSDQGTLPRIDTTVPAPSSLAARASERPKTRPKPQERIATSKPKTVKPGAAPRSKKQAAQASGRKKEVGKKPSSAAKSERVASPALMRQWGSSIRSAVERRKRYPSGTRARGKVTLSVSVSTSGKLAGVRVVRSSGNASLDKAAVTAVRRARFKAAPQGLRAGTHSFSLPISFAP